MRSKTLITLIGLAIIGSSAVEAEGPSPLSRNPSSIAAEQMKYRKAISSICDSLQQNDSVDKANQWKSLRNLYGQAGIVSRLTKLEKLSETDFLIEEGIAANPETSIEVLQDGTLIRKNGNFSQQQTPPDDPGYKQQLEYYKALYWWFDFSRVKPIPPKPDFSKISFIEDGAFTGSSAYSVLQDAMRDIDNGYFDNAQMRLDFLLKNKFVQKRMPDVFKKAHQEYRRLCEIRKSKSFWNQHSK